MSLPPSQPRLCSLWPNDDEARRAVLDWEVNPYSDDLGDPGDMLIPLGPSSVPGKLFGEFIHDSRTVHFSLTLDAFSRRVLLQDFSEGQTTHVIRPATSCVFQGRNRQLIFPFEENVVLGFGIAGQNLLHFQLTWPADVWYQHEPIDIFPPTIPAPIARQQEKSIFAGPTLFQDPNYQAVCEEPLLRGYMTFVEEVWRAESGRMVARKTIQVFDRTVTDNFWTANRAIKLSDLARDLGKLRDSAPHPCIVELIAVESSDDWDANGGPWDVVQIFMSLEYSTVQRLVTSDLHSTDADHLGDTIFDIPAISVYRKLLYSMLLALEYLGEHRIVHRNIDPACILYSWTGGCEPSSITFKLGGMRLGNHIDLDPPSTRPEACFKAPELDFDTNVNQDKVDVWSFFVTMLWCMDVEDSRYELVIEDIDRHEMMTLVVAVADVSPEVSDFRQMGVLDWRLRASAAQMLNKLSVSDPTRPRGVVPPLAPYPYPQLATSTRPVDLTTHKPSIILRALGLPPTQTQQGSATDARQQNMPGQESQKRGRERDGSDSDDGPHQRAKIS